MESGMKDVQIQLAQAIRRVQSGVRWKAGKGDQHLAKRIRQGHLPATTALDEYEAIIQAIASHPEASVYVYQFGPTDYPTVVAPYQGRIWLAMFNLDGVMETAFPPDEPDTYFNADPRYIPVGSLREIL
jgi:hypothetical protein